MKIKNYLYILSLAVLAIAACKKDTYIDNSRETAFAQYGKDTVIIKKFIKDNNIPAVKDSTYDVYYQIISLGTGTVKPTSQSVVTVAYKGRLLNGTAFDQSDSLKYPLGRLISGWNLGLPKIRKGGKIRLIIPSAFGYGTSAAGTIPPNSILDFDIELKEIQ